MNIEEEPCARHQVLGSRGNWCFLCEGERLAQRDRKAGRKLSLRIPPRNENERDDELDFQSTVKLSGFRLGD